MNSRLLSALFLVSILASVAAEPKKTSSPPPPTRLNQYVYLLKLVPRLYDDNAWTDEDKKTVATHFAHLKAAADEGKVILAGRTLEAGSRTMGMVIFEAFDTDAATKFMNTDPAIKGKVMTATVHPYQIALQRKPQ